FGAKENPSAPPAEPRQPELWPGTKHGGTFTPDAKPSNAQPEFWPGTKSISNKGVVLGLIPAGETTAPDAPPSPVNQPPMPE
ncbi:MAG TPA: hypothetical protein VN641_01625, partial [Urbifossiella sp.]|nr:hypothetical protein [Urbifossiella sp.]